jgi:hypothetical protein
VQTHIDLVFADGTYRFALGLAQISELQEKCGVGIGGLYARVLQGRVDGDVTVGHPAFAAYYAADLVETVRQGLIGGGQGWVNDQDVKVSAMRANDLVDRYLLALPLVEQWNLAASILYAKVEGYTPPEDKKKAPRKPTPKAGEGGLITPAP